MSPMLKCFLTTYRIRLSTAVNRWIYYLRKIPLIKHLFPASLYHKTGLKDGLSCIMVLYAVLSELFKKSFYIAVLYGLVIMNVPPDGPRLAAFLQLFLFFSVIGGSMNNLMMFQTDELRRMFLKIMRFDSSLYIRTYVYSEYLMYTVFMLPGMIIAILLFDGNILLAPALLSLALGAHTAIDYLQMKWFEKRHTLPLIKHNIKIVFISFLVFIAGIVLILQGWILQPLVNICYIGFLGIPITAAVFMKINRYPYFSEASQLSINYFNQMISAAGTGDSAFQDVVIRDKDIAEMTSDRNTFANRHGYEYLNALFFHRQKRIFFRPVRNRLLILTALALFIIILGRIIKVSDQAAASLNALFPGLVFIMYIMNIGIRATRSLFYNCDASLLQYSFYRRKDAVLKNFAIRLRHLVTYNMIPAAVLCIYLTVGISVLHIPISAADMTISIITILLLSVLFSVHYLFLYYVFQPFTKDYNEKNPFYTILNNAMYIVCLTVMNLHVEIANFVIYVFLFTITYILIALFCVYRYAPKTFRIK